MDHLAIATELDFLRLSGDGDGWVWSAAGRAGAEGRRGAVAVSGLSLDFDLDLVGEDGLVNLSARASAPQALTMQVGSVFGVDVRNLSVTLSEARPGRAFLAAGGASVQAAARVSDLEVFAARRGLFGARLRAPAGELGFDGASGAGPRVDARLQGPRIDGLAHDGRVGRLEARILNMQADLGAPWIISALFQALALSGDAAPVSVADAAGEVRVRVADGAVLDGRINVARAQIEDGRAAPRFSPLRIAFVGGLDGPVLDGGGWVKHAASGRDLAEVTLNADVLTRTGRLEFTGVGVGFSPEGLQPGAVVPLLGEVFPNASGSVDVSGSITRAAVDDPWSFPVDVTFNEVAFDANYGRLEGVAGAVSFSDILSLRTTGAQSIAIARYDPGIPLLNGNATFALQGPDRVIVSSAQFEFAGGQVVLEPIDTQWNNDVREGVARLIAVDLADMGALLQPSGLRLEGAVSGIAPFVVDQRQVSLRDAQIRSDGPGRIRLRPRQDLVTGIVADAGLGDALRDVAYSELTASADGGLDGQMVVGLNVLGGATSINSAFTIDLGDWVRGDPRRDRTTQPAQP